MRFDLRTGKSLSSTLGVDKLKIFPVRTNALGFIEIGFDELVFLTSVAEDF